MTEPCEDCAVGRIGSVRIRASEWIEANTAFLAVTQHFNDHTDREALFYPGVVVVHRFCGDCGSPVKARMVPWPEGTKGCTREEYLRWLSDHVIPGFASKYGVEQV